MAKLFQPLSNWRTWFWILGFAILSGSGTQFCRNTIPAIDYGHRCFRIRDERTAKILLPLLQPFGLTENFTFSPGETNQTLLSDGTTVLIWFNKAVSADLQQNGFSIVSDNPADDADWVAGELRQEGFKCQIRHDIFPPEMKEKIVILESDAFLGWVMVFRRHSFKMGERPNLRNITPR